MSAWWDPLQELASSLPLLLMALFALGAIALVSARRRWREFHRRPPRPVVLWTSLPFERGFDLLLDARWQEAVQVLTAAVKAEPHRVLEYLELGKLFRRQGEPGRAARIFEHLIARPTLDSGVRVMAQYELGLAYRVLGFHEAAASTLEEVLRSDPLHREARQELRRTHEEMGWWEKAIAVERARVKRGEAADHQILAALRTQQAKSAWVAGELRQSVAHLRAALGLDQHCTEATLYLGRLLLRRGKLRQARRLWEELARVRPEFLYLAFRDMQATFQQLHDEAGWEAFLYAFTERHCEDPSGHLALAEWYATQKRPVEAMARLRRVLDIDPMSPEAHLALLTLYRRQGVPADVLETYELLARATTSQDRRRFRCRVCGHIMGEPLWKCPACQVWATPEPLRPSMGRTPPAPVETAHQVEHAVAGRSPLPAREG